MSRTARLTLEAAKIGSIFLGGLVLALAGAAVFDQIPKLFQRGAEQPVKVAANPLIGVWVMHDPSLAADCTYRYTADTMRTDCGNGGQVTPVIYNFEGATATVTYGDGVDVLTMISPDEFVGVASGDPSVHVTRHRCRIDNEDLCAAEFASRQPDANEAVLAAAPQAPVAAVALAPAPAKAAAAPAPSAPNVKNFSMAALAEAPPPTPPAPSASTAAPEPPPAPAPSPAP